VSRGRRALAVVSRAASAERRPGRGWLVAFLLACLVNVAVLYTPESGPGVGIPLADKAVHLLLFAAVAFTGRKSRLSLAWLAGVLVLNAALSEIVQHLWLSQRSGDVLDAVADVAGVALGGWLAGGWRSRST
jgi:VanZ family protein